MKILHVIASLNLRLGGPPKACMEMAKAVAGLGHEVTIFSTASMEEAEEMGGELGSPFKRDGVTVVLFDRLGKGRIASAISISLARALSRQVSEYDVVHTHSLYLFHNLVAGHYCRKHGVPYIVRPHGTLDPFLYHRHRFRKSIVEWLFENRNMAHSAALHYTAAEEMELAAPFVHGAPGFVVPLGLHLDEYRTLPEAGRFREKYPEMKGRKIILFLSRINFKKGLDLLIKGFAEAARGRDDLHLAIVGPEDAGFGDTVRDWIATEGIQNRVTFTGMLAGVEKLAAFKDAEMFVLPSYSENFGISVIEAMACGLPVVISDKVNIWREVKNAGAGKVVSCKAPEVAAAILGLLDSRDAVAMGENAKTMVEQQFQWNKIALQLETVYEKIVSGCSREVFQR